MSIDSINVTIVSFSANYNFCYLIFINAIITSISMINVTRIIVIVHLPNIIITANNAVSSIRDDVGMPSHPTLQRSRHCVICDGFFHHRQKCALKLGK